jgi:hypothetical protein
VNDLGILATKWQQQLSAPSVGRKPATPKRIAVDIL